MPPHQHGTAGRFHDERMSPSIPGYSSPGPYSPGRMSPSGGPGAKKSRLLPQLPPGREPMGKKFKQRRTILKLTTMNTFCTEDNFIGQVTRYTLSSHCTEFALKSNSFAVDLILVL